MVKTRLDYILPFLLSVLSAQYASTTEYKCNPEHPCGCSTQSVIISELSTYEIARFDSWNWLVSLQNENGSHLCHGSILNENFIITAAHCLPKTPRSLSNITICIGADRLSDSCREQHAIDKVTTHPLYDDETFENDIALIRIRTPLNFINKSIARICLAQEDLQVDAEVMAISWNTNDTINDLQQMRMQIPDQSTETCGSVSIDQQLQLCVPILTNSRILLWSLIVCHLIRFSSSSNRFLST